MPVSFPRLGKFSAIICSNICSVPLFLSSSSGTSIILILFHFLVSLISRSFPHGPLVVFISLPQVPSFPSFCLLCHLLSLLLIYPSC